MPSSATASATATVTAPNPQPQLLEGGEGFFPALVAALDGARDWVQLETYIFDFHGRGADVAEALMRAAQRGVTVQVLVDGIGSAHLADEAQPSSNPSKASKASSGPERLRQAGVQWQRYSPLTGLWPTLDILHPDQ